MAKKIVEIYTCDICKKETEKTNIKTLTIPVRWLTEQNEGRSIKPYITTETKDICEECLERITKVNATGAQGFNDYKIVVD